MLKLESCPVCDSRNHSHFLTCTDHTVSKEKFDIVRCADCGFKFTNPIPPIEKLGDYYKSNDYVSHSSSKKGLINFIYNQVRKTTLKQKVKLVNRLSKGKKLLDFGCGTGHFLSAAKRSGFEVLGIEPDNQARTFAIEKNNITALSRNEFLGLNSTFNIITLWHVLEHLPELNEDIARFKHLLDKDGVLLIAVPNPDSCDANYYKEFWAGYDVPRHLYHFSPNVLERLMSKHGFELQETLPMKYDAYYVAMLSEKSQGKSALKGFLNGFRSNKRAKKNPNTWSSQIYIFKQK